MKRFRILAAALLMIVLGTSAAFADVISIPVLLVRSGALYVIIAVIVLIIALILLRRSLRKRSMMIDGNEPEEPEDNEVN
jgi:membrane protein implicated in regulation of membrane protease activity